MIFKILQAKIFSILGKLFCLFFIMVSHYSKLDASEEKFFHHYGEMLYNGLLAYTNFDFEQADSIFQQIEKSSAYYPIAGFFRMNNQYSRLKYDGKLQAANRYILENSPQLLLRFDDYADKNPGPMCHLYAGVSHSLNSRIFMGQGQYLKALHNGMKAIIAVNKAEKLSPGDPEICLAQGTYNYFGGVMADHFSAVNLIYNSEEKRNLGLQQLEKAWNEGHFARWEAGGLLLMLELYEQENYPEAKKLGTVLTERFPGNPEFMAHYIEALIYLGALEEARRLLLDYPKIYAGRIAEPGVAVWEIRQRYLEALHAMQSGNLDMAKGLFKNVMENYNFEFRWHLAIILYK
ncbi:MAG TPA: tetratricopeptide repeat protein, partial [Candidatus Marinimicrobia bacterium]|nr:tetratricopeptide repeat protein [Candidatus Neomarinimicrobiota bacterium]